MPHHDQDVTSYTLLEPKPHVDIIPHHDQGVTSYTLLKPKPHVDLEYEQGQGGVAEPLSASVLLTKVATVSTAALQLFPRLVCSAGLLKMGGALHTPYTEHGARGRQISQFKVSLIYIEYSRL